MIIKLFSIISPFVAICMVISFLLLFLSFVGFIIFNLINKAKGKSISFKSKYFGILKISGMALICLILLQKAMVFLIILEIDSRLSDSKVEIELNDSRVENVDHIRESFEKRFYSKLSGSSPEGRVDLIIKNNGEDFVLELAVDSRDDSLFWVYFPDYMYFGSLFYVRSEVL